MQTRRRYQQASPAFCPHDFNVTHGKRRVKLAPETIYH